LNIAYSKDSNYGSLGSKLKKETLSQARSQFQDIPLQFPKDTYLFVSFKASGILK